LFSWRTCWFCGRFQLGPQGALVWAPRLNRRTRSAETEHCKIERARDDLARRHVPGDSVVRSGETGDDRPQQGHVGERPRPDSLVTLVNLEPAALGPDQFIAARPPNFSAVRIFPKRTAVVLALDLGDEAAGYVL